MHDSGQQSSQGEPTTNTSIRMHLYLPEIRVHREIECDIAGDAYLGIEPHIYR